MPGFTDRQSFSTDEILPSQSLRTWQEYMREVYFSLEIETRGVETVSGTLLKRSFASTHVSAMASDGQRVIRSLQLAKRDNVESFCVVFPTHGTFEYRQRGKEAVAGPGDAYILNASEPYEVDIAHGAKMLCFTLPCDLVRAHTKNIDDLCGSNQFADPVLASTLRRLAECTLRVAPAVDADRLQNLCLDMIDMMVLGSSPQSLPQCYDDVVATDIIERAGKCANRFLHDPLFTVSHAARACGVSVRQLQNAYHRKGTTFSTELLRARLDKAYRLLRSNDSRPRLLVDVATDCGFVSQAHFSTCYRSRFGHSPG